VVRRPVLAAALAVAALALALSGCGSSKSSSPTTAPTVSLWVSGTAQDYRQVAAGVKLALAEAGGHAGAFRVNYAGRQVSADPARSVADAVGNARTSLQDTQASAVITDAGVDAARPAITLLNEAGISAVALGDASLEREACSAASDIYPAGHETAIVVPGGSGVPSDFASRFRDRLGFAPTESAWRAYQGAKAVLSSLAARGVATGNNPPRLDRDALAAELVRAHGGC
jgi:ABC-type branched-subunit amino acid transport system substrate-binding protein